MAVAVAHQISAAGPGTLKEAAREAALRKTNLVVIHVTESFDLDTTEAHRGGLSDEIEEVLSAAGLGDIEWDLKMGTGEDVAESVLELAEDAELLVIGARRRSPVGKFLLGSVTQSIILDAKIPILVVKP
jgi:nucleotide-binding universal stress UspA family protein